MLSKTIAAVMSVSLLCPGGAGAAPWPVRWVAIGAESRWMLIEAKTHRIERIQTPSPAEDLAVSPDGSLVAYTGPGDNGNTLLYIWERHTALKPAQIGDLIGYHADPSFSGDGRFLYFAHSSQGHGKPNAHTRRAYAQIYRVRPSGDGLEQLTHGDGCHFAPGVLGHRLIFVHTSCHGMARSVVAFDVRSKSQTATLIDQRALPLAEMTPSPDRARLMFSTENTDTLSVQELDVKSGRLTKVVEYAREGHYARPRYGSDGEIFYLKGSTVWVANRRSNKLFATLEER